MRLEETEPPLRTDGIAFSNGLKFCVAGLNLIGRYVTFLHRQKRFQGCETSGLANGEGGGLPLLRRRPSQPGRAGPQACSRSSLRSWCWRGAPAGRRARRLRGRRKR